ncbi:MAG: spore germination protein [Clostridia bacterium]|nr:spore germination protein [Clostridia bacterium]
MNISDIKAALKADESYDIVYRTLKICDTDLCLFFVDGFIKDSVAEKIIEFFYSIKDKTLLKDAYTFSKNCVPYTEVDLLKNTEQICTAVLSGQMAVVCDGFDRAVLIDVRTYPQRDNATPEKDKVLRGSNDGFVETLVLNTALIRRRIRDTNLRMKSFTVGNESKTDVVLCYMDNKADKKLLATLTQKIQNINVKSLTMNIQSIAEAIYHHKWYNPFPKIKYTERPDTAASAVLDGNIVIIVDNAPSVLIIPTSIFDIMEEADDYYFPMVTGTYIRLSRWLVTILSMLITPLWLLALQNPEYVPEVFRFILLDESPNIPVFWQLMILEIAIDGLRLAAINTPNMLSTPLSIIGGIVLSDFSVQSGWFAAESILYMAIVAITNYSQPSYELGYAIKFMRIIILVLTAIFNLWGFIGGIIITFIFIATNHTISGKSYLYPLFPFNAKKFLRTVIRVRS